MINFKGSNRRRIFDKDNLISIGDRDLDSESRAKG